MRFTEQTTTEGMLERIFTLDTGGERVPGVIWSPDGAPTSRPIVLMGHGGGQHKKFPGIVSRAHKYVTSFGFAVVAMDAPGHGERTPSKEDSQFVEELRHLATTGKPFGEVVARQNARVAQIAVPEWQAALDAVQAPDLAGENGPVGYWGVSMGGAIGVHLIAAEPRIKAAVIGLVGLFPNDQDLAEAAARVRVPIEFVLQLGDQTIPRDASMALFDAFGTHEKTLHANPGGHTEVPSFEQESWERFFVRHLLPAK